MSDTNQKIDDKKGDDVLAKMLKTKPNNGCRENPPEMDMFPDNPNYAAID